MLLTSNLFCHLILSFWDNLPQVKKGRFATDVSSEPIFFIKKKKKTKLSDEKGLM